MGVVLARAPAYVDLAFTCALAVCAVLAELLLPDGSPLRVALAVPLVLIVPGYAIVSAALHRSPIGLAERLTLGLGLSLAIAACGGLLLNASPWGLRTGTWTTLLGVLTIAASLVAAYLRAADPASVTAPLAHRLLAVRPIDVGLLAAAVLLGAGALRFSSPLPAEQPSQAYTVLWAVPDRQVASTIHLGVQNMDLTRQDYVLRVDQYDQTLQEYAIQLEPTQTWEADLQLSPGPADVGGDLHAVLYRADSPFTPFRQTVIRAAT